MGAQAVMGLPRKSASLRPSSNLRRRYGQGNEGHEGDEEEGSREGHEGDEEEGRNIHAQERNCCSNRRRDCTEEVRCLKVLASLTGVATAQVSKAGKFAIPGLVMLKKKTNPARAAGKKLMFGKEVHVKAAKAKTIVKAYCVKALKDSV